MSQGAIFWDIHRPCFDPSAFRISTVWKSVAPPIVRAHIRQVRVLFLG